MKTYKELIRIPSFEERLKYLQLTGVVGYDTFGPDRYLNQQFYASSEWKHARQIVLARDLGCDLALSSMEIRGRVLIHHLNPITKEDIIEHADCLTDPDNLVCVSENTHNLIHYPVSDSGIPPTVIGREPGDTTLWKTRR